MPADSRPRIAFVTKCFATELVGGGETLVREFGRVLREHGYAVEVLTTTMGLDLSTAPPYTPGVSWSDGLAIRRFPVCSSNRAAMHSLLVAKIGARLAHTVEEEYDYFDYGLHSPQMYEYLASHGRSFRAVIVLDYFVGLSLYAAASNCGITIVYPQLHREPIAYLLPVRRFLNSVDGIMFNCPPEADFARWELGVTNPRRAIVGVGVQTDLVGNGNRFRQRFGIESEFLLYVGRLHVAKNVDELIRCFQHYRSFTNSAVKLVLIGQGAIKLPGVPGIIGLGHCSEQDKFDAYAAAMALVQPSLLESLSIVVLEALAQGTPILVHGANDVTRYHCLTGNCGLYYYGKDDFVAAVDFLYDHPRIRQELGRNGREYVLENYHWDKVSARLIAALERFTT